MIFVCEIESSLNLSAEASAPQNDTFPKGDVHHRRDPGEHNHGDEEHQKKRGVHEGDRRPLEERGVRVEEEDVNTQSHQQFAQSPEVSAATEHLRQSKPPGGNQAVANEKNSISLRCLQDLFCLRRAS